MNIQVLLGWLVVSVGTPIEKFVKYSGGTVCGKPGGPEGMIPSVPIPVTKPETGQARKAALGLFVVVDVRKKLTRASFTAVGPKVFVLLITIC